MAVHVQTSSSAAKTKLLLCAGLFWKRQEHVPVLQQVLGVLDLVLCSCDGDDAVLGAL